ncbi:hypothetical protein GWI33_014918 [Rhynchophorus ferrugineus]|uniref:Uncharacterized protein n=1 Tax=Rhynchophorus ferrugineus TaxID=354439 RepID=A0A834MBX0_RHYFE|nr:hypothetical protein GWI33_014918 [Rhynchophorus ferrugineus]
MQTKENVKRSSLSQVISTRLSKASKKPITGAAFLSQLTGENSERSEQTEEKIITPRVRSRLDKADSYRDFDHTDLDKLTEPLSPNTTGKTTNATENLSDSDLQTLLKTN